MFVSRLPVVFPSKVDIRFVPLNRASLNQTVSVCRKSNGSVSSSLNPL